MVYIRGKQNNFILMNSIIAAIIVMLSGQLLLAQSELFDLQPGIKSITTIQIRGNSTKLDSTTKRVLRYDAEGRLVELDFQHGKISYAYSNDSTVVSTSSNSPNCKEQYRVSRKTKRSVIRWETLPGSSDCSFAPSEPMVFGNINADSLFEDVPKSLPKRGREYAATVRVWGEEEGEYMDLSYTKSGSQLRLSFISQFQKIGENYFVQRLFVVAYQDRIILEQQRLLDREKMPITQLGTDELIKELSPAQKNNYEYERDDHDNWTVRKPQNMNSDRQQYTLRVIEYWD